MSDKKSYPGINIQWPISKEISSGKKTIETRTYPIPEKYLDCEILLIETPGKQGQFKARITAIIKFTNCFKYKSKKEFYEQENKHLVSIDSPWAWVDGQKWGWEVEVIKVLSKNIQAPKAKGIRYTLNIQI